MSFQEFQLALLSMWTSWVKSQFVHQYLWLWRCHLSGISPFVHRTRTEYTCVPRKGGSTSSCTSFQSLYSRVSSTFHSLSTCRQVLKKFQPDPLFFSACNLAEKCVFIVTLNIINDLGYLHYMFIHYLAYIQILLMKTSFICIMHILQQVMAKP